MARAWVELGTARWGPVQHCLASLRRLGYVADRFGSGLVRVVGPAGSGGSLAPSRPPTPSAWSGPMLVGVGAAAVTLDRRGRPAVVLDALSETWTVEAVTGIWRRPGTVPPADVRTAWRVRLTCWHTPPPGTPAVVEQLGNRSWRLRPPR